MVLEIIWLGFCMTYPIRPARWRMVSPVMSRPSSRMVPEPGASKPQMSFERVDLPAPLRPTMLTISPLRTAKEMFCRVVRSLV